MASWLQKQKSQTEVVWLWTCSKVKRACQQDNLTRHSAGTESKRQTEKQMAEQHPRIIDGQVCNWMRPQLREDEDMEELAAEVFCGAPTVLPTSE